MSIATSFINMIARAIGYFAAQQIDHIISKWLAYFMIAWEKASSEKAKNEYRIAILSISESLAERYADWAEWRKKHLQG